VSEPSQSHGFWPRRGTVGTAFGAAVAVGLLWLSPVSPMALSQGDVAVGNGQPDVAVARYDQVARYSPFRSLREEALWRGAMVSAVDLGDDKGALKRFRTLLAHMPDSEHAAEAWDQIGHLLIARDQRNADAGVAFGHSFRIAPGDAQADQRLTRSAHSYAEANLLVRSDRAYEQLARTFPELKARSLIGRAENEMLRKNIQEALALYEDAIPHANDANVRAVARFGAASCLERLGNLDEAIAALDSADVPTEVSERRRTGISNRRDARDSE